MDAPNIDRKSLADILQFLREAEQLKDTLRSSYTSGGRRESVAEHSWRLCLFAVVLAPRLPEVDLLRLLKICIIHDLGEAINGDIPAPLQSEEKDKSTDERRDFRELTGELPGDLPKELMDLWDEYENASSAEGKLAKALDKLETILQHNQGKNPEDFDYAYNLDYGRKYTADQPVIREIRKSLDEETQKLAEQSGESE